MGEIHSRKKKESGDILDSTCKIEIRSFVPFSTPPFLEKRVANFVFLHNVKLCQNQKTKYKKTTKRIKRIVKKFYYFREIAF
jgi:hypothetical protein